MVESERRGTEDISKYGEVLYTNVTSPNQADVIGVGEFHRPALNEKVQEIKNWGEKSNAEVNAILKSILAPGDVLLLEGAPHIRLPWILAKILYKDVPRGVKVYGWDNNRKRKDAKKLIRSHPGEEERNEVVIEERNTSLVEQINRQKERHPSSRVVFVAGFGHINAALGENLGNGNNRYSLIGTREAIHAQKVVAIAQGFARGYKK